jgi:predicted nucleic acid-binding protein
MRGIADTSFIVGFANRADEYHDWALNVGGQVSEPLLTCEPVLAEAAHHLKDVRIVLGMIHDGLITLAFDCMEHLPQLHELAERYSDRRPDLADLCLIRMSELFPKHPIITTDRDDFRIYRRNKREMIPLICPPE